LTQAASAAALLTGCANLQIPVIEVDFGSKPDDFSMTMELSMRISALRFGARFATGLRVEAFRSYQLARISRLTDELNRPNLRVE
jgi:hypothetical protein